MATSPTTSSVFPPPPSPEELRQLWSYNRQYRFTNNRPPFSRPDRNPSQDLNPRQVLIIRPALNLRPGLNHNHRQVPYPVPFPRQPAPVPRPVLNFPEPQGWTWVPSPNRTGLVYRFRRVPSQTENSIQTTDRCQLCRRNLIRSPPPPTTRTVGTSTTQDAAELQEEIWDEVERNLNDLFREQAEDEDDPSYLRELEGMTEEIALIREEQREALRNAEPSTDPSRTFQRRR